MLKSHKKRYDGGEKEDELRNIVGEQKNSPTTVKHVIELINSGVDLNQIFEGGYTVLHISAYFGYLDYIRLFIDNGAYIDIQDIRTGETALHVATSIAESSDIIDQEQKEIIKFLIKSGANKEILDNSGHTARDNFPILYDKIETEIILEALEELRRLETALLSYSKSEEYSNGIEEEKIDIEILKYIFDIDKMKL